MNESLRVTSNEVRALHVHLHRAPEGHAIRHQELAGLSEVSALPGHGEVNAELVDAVLGEAAKFAQEVLDPLNREGDKQGAQLADGKSHRAQGLQGGLPQVRRGGLERPRRATGVRRAGVAARHRDAGAGNLEEREHGAVPVPDADLGRARGAEGPRLRRSRREPTCPSSPRASGPAP